MRPQPRPSYDLQAILSHLSCIEERLGKLERVEGRVAKLEGLEHNLVEREK